MSQLVKTSLVAVVCLMLAGVYFLLTRDPPGPDANYNIRVVDAEGQPENLPVLPDVSGYTTAAVLERMPAQTPEFKVSVDRMAEHYDSVPEKDIVDTYGAMQQAIDARLIVVSEGVVDMPKVYQAVANEKYIERQGNEYLVHVPIFVRNGATLIIQGEDSSLKLAKQSGTFIAARGNVYIVNTKITGWDTDKNAPSEYESKSDFRPFIVFWSEAEGYIAGSKIAYLGYESSKSYGVTYTTHGVLTRADSTLKRPTGWVVDSYFEDIYYAFYSYEADDIAIVGNEYNNNVIYAIDPHDRSERLIIANNKTHNTRFKHGIILSREVNNSWVFGNETYENAGSGIMMDRASEHNVIANNISHHNNGDGISFYESSDNLSWGNTYNDNEISGVRVRNSRNITLVNDKVLNNKKYGFEAYTDTLDEEARDLIMDPYEQRIGFTIYGLEMNNNRTGQLRFENVETARFENLKAFQIGRGFMEGDLKAQAINLYSMMTQPKSAVIVQNREALVSRTEPSAGDKEKKEEEEPLKLESDDEDDGFDDEDEE